MRKYLCATRRLNRLCSDFFAFSVAFADALRLLTKLQMRDEDAANDTIVVTANRRTQDVTKILYNIAVVGGEQLALYRRQQHWRICRGRF